MQKTGIEWTDFSSALLKYRDADGKVVWHCEKTSPGCAHCYAEAIAERFNRGGPFLPVVTPDVTPFFDEAEARKLLRSKAITGKRVFINDMTDGFGDWVPDEIIDRHFAVFALRPDVTFQLLTKRAGRMRDYLTRLMGPNGYPGENNWLEDAPRAHCMALKAAQTIRREWCGDPYLPATPWPLPNVMCGVSVEDQARADERIPSLLQVPAAVRFLSCEPLLGPVLLDGHHCHRCSASLPGGQGGWFDGDACPRCGAPVAEGTDRRKWLDGIHWVILGGESGHNARPCDLAWVRSLVAQCRAAGVACFVKQLGAAPVENHPRDEGRPWRTKGVPLRDPKGGDIEEFPRDLRVREFPEARP